MLLCEEMFLLETLPSGKQIGSATGSGKALGVKVAVIADLVMSGRVRLGDKKRPRLELTDTAPTGHVVLDEALRTLAAKNGRPLQAIFAWGGFRPRESVAASLAQAGVIDIRKGGIFGMTTSYPTVDPEPRRQLLARLGTVLRGEAQPSQADCTLLALVKALGYSKKVFPQEYAGMGKKAFNRRVDELAGDDRLGREVKQYIQEMVSVAVIAGVAVAGSSSS
ncbi:MAG: GPP34 family phosphoprotein [Actinomycetaceae bacterium]|nr:GPP34 family phosphoprotein [Actinomycetaceae bacterium]